MPRFGPDDRTLSLGESPQASASANEAENNGPRLPPAPAQVAPTPHAGMENWDTLPSAPVAPGKAPPRLGEYELLAEIARGGMGVVYKARHTRLNRVVALKMILSGQLAGAEEIRRFQAEAQAAAGLDHPGIVPVHEFGEIDGRPYFSMGFVEGQSLAVHLREGPMPPREAAEIVRQISLAVQYAHDRGVIHRDLKPGNVLLEKVDSRHAASNGDDETLSADAPPLSLEAIRRARVTDFGLAKRTQDDSGLTATGQILGTPSYMPPEQAAGKHEQVGVTADVYSLGAVLYATLTSRPPFQAASITETLRQVIERDPVSPRALNPAVPRDLETIALRCLQKEAADRYPSAAALAEELRRFLAGEPIAARPAGRGERAVRWCRRQPVAAALIAVATLLLAVLAVGGPIVAAREAGLRQAADTGRAKADEQSRLASDRAEQLQKTSGALQNRTQELAQEVTRANLATDRAKEQSALRAEELERAESVLVANRLRQARQFWTDNDYSQGMEQLELCPPARRGWEWHYLARQCQRLRLIYENHDNSGQVVFHPDGERLLSSGQQRDGMVGEFQVKLWNASTGQETLSVVGDAACLLEEGKQIAVMRPEANKDRAVVQLYDANDGSLIRQMEGESAAGVALHPGPEPATVCMIDAAGMLRVWNTRTGQRVFAMQACQGRPKVNHLSNISLTGSVRFSGNGRFVCVFPAEGAGQCIDLQERKATDIRLGELDGVGLNNNATRMRTRQQIDEMGLVCSVTLSPDGRWLLKHSLAERPLLEICDPLTGEVKSVLSMDRPSWRRGYFRAMFNAIAFSHDGSLVACGTGMANSREKFGEVAVFSVETGAELAHMPLGAESAMSLAFSPDNARLAVAGATGRVQLRDSASGELLQTFRHGSSGGAYALAFSPDGQTLAVGSLPLRQNGAAVNMTYHVWDLRSRQDRTQVAGLSYLAQQGTTTTEDSLALDYYGLQLFHQNDPKLWFSGDSQRLHRAVDRRPRDTWKMQSVRMTDFEPAAPETDHPRTSLDGQRRLEITGRSLTRSQFRFSPGQFRLIDVASGNALLTRDEPNWLRAGGFSADGKSLALLLEPDHFRHAQGQAPAGFQLVVLDAVTGQEKDAWKSGDAAINACELSADGKLVAAVVTRLGHSIEMRLWDTITGERHSLVESRGPIPFQLCFSPDGAWLAAVFRDHAIRVWSTRDRRHRWTLRATPQRVTSIAFSPDSTRLFAAAEDAAIRIWDLAWGQELAMLDCGDVDAEELALSPDGRWLAALDHAAAVWLWDAAPLPEPAHATYPPSAAELTRQIEAGQDSASVYRQRGEAYLRHWQFPLAAEDFAQAAKRSPADPAILQTLEKTAIRANRWDLAESAVRGQIVLEPKNSDRWLSLGEVLARQRQFAAGASAYEQGENLVHNNLELKSTVAALYQAANDRKNYLRVSQAARQQAIEWKWISPEHPNHARNAYLLARIASYGPELAEPAEQVEAWVRQALSVHPAVPWNLHVLGIVQLRAGNPQAAAESFQAAAKADPGWSPGMNQLGLALALFAAGDPAAREQAQGALDDTQWSQEAASGNSTLPQAWKLPDWLAIQLLRREVEKRISENSTL
ncbi:MAG: protein kinase [Pirellulales bacterium]